ncbi:probable methyltransferase-like protein 25 [Drosophila sulfurigaster albostrigata]|uniref:probable methyltransferase-like protein 25 n=1 Tax=Drosophila sulfurigaster albostrigata TaxID=89887 RepID=UPI002D21B451|nr:probable methyltransferase-like protein 25 [Drosophila sulfurigaster albostrigata]
MESRVVGEGEVKSALERLLSYLEPHWDFVNCHMVNYLTDNHWTHFVPEDLRLEACTAKEINQIIEQQFWHSERDNLQFPAFANFLAACKRFRLEGCENAVLTSVEQLEQELSVAMETQLSIKEFMSAKKCHEVEQTAALVDKLVQSVSQPAQKASCCIVDAGDGKGYLSSRLALQYGHRVLGIDSNESNTENALTRNRKLQRAWNGLTERAELQSQGIIPPRRGKKAAQRETNSVSHSSMENYKTTAQFITTDINLDDLVTQHFDQHSNGICLTGLHTCGNLATTCLQVFHAQNSCRILCNIGCCYHLLRERYSHQEFFGNKVVMEQQTEYGFPLSRYLQQKQLRLGRNARMLAAQSIERTLAAKELPNITLYYRALLELLVCRHAPQLKNELQVGKVRKFGSFSEYVQKCAKKLNAPWLAAVEEAELQALLKAHEQDRQYLELFYLIRMSFAPILESVILLDRLLYLKELGYEHSYLIDLFDAVISPRHYAIVAIKQ